MVVKIVVGIMIIKCSNSMVFTGHASVNLEFIYSFCLSTTYRWGKEVI